MDSIERGDTGESSHIHIREKSMAEEKSNRSFSETVGQQLSPETRELWAPMADHFSREGPEAVKTYLDAERERLENNVRSLLEEFNVR